MKRHIIHIINLLLLSLSLTSCEDGLAPTNVKNENSTWLLSDFSEYCYPNKTKWVIEDETISQIQIFEGISNALDIAEEKELEIELNFPNLIAIPDSRTEKNKGALESCQAVKAVTLSNAEAIGRFAFMNCKNLSTVSLPKATYIGFCAFANCSNLNNVRLPYVTDIDEYAFQHNTSLTSIDLPAATTLATSALYDCFNLTSIDLPAATTIEKTALASCDNLKSISLPAATSIGDKAFAYSPELTDLTIATKTTLKLFSGSAFISTDTSKITLTIGEANSKYISGNTLTVDTFSGTFKDIIMVDENGSEVVPTYSTLSNFTATAYPTDTDTWTITDTTAELTEDFAGLRAALQAEANSNRKITLNFPNLEQTPRGGWEPEVGALDKCTALKEVNMPKLKILGEHTFRECHNLTTANLPAATSIGCVAFYNCENLTSINLPAATTIEHLAFGNCQSLTSINLPVATSIGEIVFNSCENLTEVTIATKSTIKSIYSSAFDDTPTAQITLTTGEANSIFVSGNTLTVGEFRETFKKIIIVDEDGNEIDQPFSKLEEYSATAYPTDTDTWTITDTAVGLSEFDGLRDALQAEANADRKISLIFPNLEQIPNGGSDTGAFNNCSTLKEVYIPKLKTLGSYTFYICGNLTSIDLPTATYIGNIAFYECQSLTSINLPVATSIDECAFQNCDNLTSINLPVATSIDSYAFAYCCNLNKATIATKATIEYIASGIFYNINTDQITLTIGEANSKFISGNTLTVGNFSETFKKIIIIDEDGNEVIPHEPFSLLKDFSATAYPTDTDTWTITDTSAELVSNFNGLNDALQAEANANREITLNFPNLTEIPDGKLYSGAFYYCRTLTSVSLPMATSIGAFAFCNCHSLTSVSLPKATLIGDEAFYNCYALNSVSAPEVTSVGHIAFLSCNAMTSISFPKATSIGRSAFAGCGALTSISLPIANSIGIEAFSCCTNLTSIELPAATSINDYTFDYCRNLTSIKYGASITHIGYSPFKRCENLTNLSFNSQNYIYKDGVVYDSDMKIIICTLQAFISGSFYNSEVTEVQVDAFSRNENLTSIDLPAATLIGDETFNSCLNLTTVNLPAATSIGDRAFASCNKLSSTNLAAASSIGEGAFVNCFDLTSIDLPAATSIGVIAFSDCNKLTSINLPAATSIDEYAFSNCDNLTEATIATKTTIESIASNAFSTTSNITLTTGEANSKFISGNTLTVGEFSETFKKIIIIDEDGNEIVPEEPFSKLEDFSATAYPTDTDTWTITDSSAELTGFYGLRDALYSVKNEGREISIHFPNLREIPGPPNSISYTDGALYMCTTLAEIDMPQLTTLGNCALDRCSNITSINLPKATTIGISAFYECTNLASANLPVAASIDDMTFYGCPNISSINIPNATSIGDSAFYGCNNLTSINIPAATSIGDMAFFSCEILTEATIATKTTIESIASDAFYAVNTTQITLTTGNSNSEFVRGSTLTIGSFSKSFKEIIIVDENGNEVVPDEPTFTTLADFSATAYPTDTNTWTITDTSAQLSEFYGLRNALYSAKKDSRKISIHFPNLTEMPGSGDMYDNGALYLCTALVEIDMPKLTTLGNYALDKCSNITSIDLPKATTIGTGALYECTNLASANLPIATSIGDMAFSYCSNLTTISLPATTSIGFNAFYICENLTSIDLPAAISIGCTAFHDCDNLIEATIATKATIESIDIDAFDDTPTAQIALTTGSANSKFVSSNTLTVGDFSATFKEIIIE